MLLRIGLVDHHLNNFHADKFAALLHGPLAHLEARIVTAWESDPTGDDWCARQGVKRAAGPAEVAAGCDAVMVLAPDNVEAHRELCAAVLPAGRPTFVDKFLAPTAADARAIAGLAGQHGAPLFSASSLRFAVELEAALAGLETPVAAAFACGMGAWDLYGVHTLSLALGALAAGGAGSAPARVIDTGETLDAVVTVEYACGRRAWLDVRQADNQWEALPWSFGFRAGTRYLTGTVRDFDGFYAALMRRVVEFFRSGESPVSTQEMLGVAAVLEAAPRSRQAGGTWVSTANR